MGSDGWREDGPAAPVKVTSMKFHTSDGKIEYATEEIELPS